MGSNDFAPDDLRASALCTLARALTLIRAATKHGQREPLSAESSAFVGQLADALHNVPDWLAGHFKDDGIAADDLRRAELLIQARR